METNTGLLAKISVKSDIKLLPFILSSVKSIAINYGLNEDDADKLMLITDEACLNVINHAYRNNPEAFFDIMIELKFGQFIIGVEDRGLPFDFDSGDKDKNKGFGLTIISLYADEVRFINLGKNGKRVELIKYLSPRLQSVTRDKNTGEFYKEDKYGNQKDTPGIPFEIRLMKPEEAAKLEKLVYHTFGYTYAEFFYYPQMIKDMMKDGLLTSMIAITTDGEIIGHLCSQKAYIDSKVAELKAFMVSPEFRNRHIGSELNAKLIDYEKTRGLIGFYSEVVTLHPFSQRELIGLGGRETGILLGLIADEISFKKIKEKQSTRQTAIFYYTKLNPEPERIVFPPRKHRRIIEKIYKHGNISRVAKQAQPSELKYSKDTVIDVKIIQDIETAFLNVRYIGKDFSKSLMIHLREILLHKTEVIYLNMPLSLPEIQHLNNDIESIGFIFCGIVPEYDNGDILVYQYLNNIEIDFKSIIIESDFGKELFEYVSNQYRDTYIPWEKS